MPLTRWFIAATAVTLTMLLGTHLSRATEEGDTASTTDEKKPVDNGSEAQPATNNILGNPSFEEGDKSPQKWSIGQKVEGVTYLWDRQKSKTGKASLCLKKSVQKYFPIAQWYQTVDRKEGRKTLKVSTQVKADGTYKAIIDVLFLDKNSEWVSHHWVSYIGAKEAGEQPATHDWKEYAGEVEIPPTASKIQIGLQIYGPGKVWFDDVSAEYVE